MLISSSRKIKALDERGKIMTLELFHSEAGEGVDGTE